MFEIIIHFHMHDTATVVTADPSLVFIGLDMHRVARIEINSLEPVH